MHGAVGIWNCEFDSTICAFVLELEDTIVAIASARGGSPRGIVRLSGSRAWQLAGRLISPVLPSGNSISQPTTFAGTLSLPGLSSQLPATLFLSRAPRSYTGQDVIEVHTIGSPPILELALATFVAEGARQAGPGEFTMRAFLHRKLDLTACEAVLGLIDAVDTRQATSALRQMAGGIARPIHALRDRLLDLLAEVEAGLDFADENLEFIERSELLAGLERAEGQIQELRRQMHGRLISADRARVILAGPPNAGKSSLFNAMLGRPAALVSHASGTTRDYLLAPLVLSQCTVELVDTAGIEQTADAIGRLAQSAREQAVAFANLVLWCDDGVAGQGTEHVLPTTVPSDAERIVVRTKADLHSSDNGPREEFYADSPPRFDNRRCKVIAVSALTGAGLDQLRDAIQHWARGLGHDEPGVVASTATRCRHAIDSAAQAVGRAIVQVRNGMSNELTAIEIRLALDELGQVVGAVYTDDILDRVFSRFCIGK